MSKPRRERICMNDGCEWIDDEIDRLRSSFAEREREIEALREPIKDTYACQKCGRRDGLDCVIPSQLWNQIEAETGHNVLCAWCLDYECHKRGWNVLALLAFAGKAISAGTDPNNDDKHWETHLGNLNARCSRAEDEIERLREALECIAGFRQPIDNLMSNIEIAKAALGREGGSPHA